MPILTSGDYQIHKDSPLSTTVKMNCEFENGIETAHRLTDIVEPWWNYSERKITPEMLEDRKRNRPKYVSECLACGHRKILDRSHDDWVRWAVKTMRDQNQESERSTPSARSD